MLIIQLNNLLASKLLEGMMGNRQKHLKNVSYYNILKSEYASAIHSCLILYSTECRMRMKDVKLAF